METALGNKEWCTEGRESSTLMAGEPRRRCGPAEESRFHCLGGERRKSRLPKEITFTPVCKCACRLAEGRASPVQPPSHSQKPLAICHRPGLPACRKLLADLLWTGHLRQTLQWPEAACYPEADLVPLAVGSYLLAHGGLDLQVVGANHHSYL